MTKYTTSRRHSSDSAHRAEFARQATIGEFGWRHARELDQADFVDRAPGLVPFGKVAGRIVQRLAEAQEVRHAPR